MFHPYIITGLLKKSSLKNNYYIIRVNARCSFVCYLRSMWRTHPKAHTNYKQRILAALVKLDDFYQCYGDLWMNVEGNWQGKPHDIFTNHTQQDRLGRSQDESYALYWSTTQSDRNDAIIGWPLSWHITADRRYFDIHTPRRSVNAIHIHSVVVVTYDIHGNPSKTHICMIGISQTRTDA